MVEESNDSTSSIFREIVVSAHSTFAHIVLALFQKYNRLLPVSLTLQKISYKKKTMKFLVILINFSLFANRVMSSGTLIEELRQLKKEQPVNKLPKFARNNDNPVLRAKRAIREHYSDLHCIRKFETSPQTIIRTQESRNNGATFLNVTTLDSYNMCLSSCCDTTLCNVAIFDEEVY